MIDLALLLSFEILFPKYRIYKHMKKSIIFYLLMNGVDSPDAVLKYLVLQRLKGSFLAKVINTVIKMLALLIIFIFFLESFLTKVINMVIKMLALLIAFIFFLGM
jgi:hypothetical protein